MLVTCSIGRTSHQSLMLYTVARLDTRWRDIEDGNGLPVDAQRAHSTTNTPKTLVVLGHPLSEGDRRSRSRNALDRATAEVRLCCCEYRRLSVTSCSRDRTK